MVINGGEERGRDTQMRLHYLDEGGQGFPIRFTEPLLDLHHVHFTAGHNHTGESAFISTQALQAQSNKITMADLCYRSWSNYVL